MFDIKIEFDNVKVASIEKDDVREIYNWLKDNDDYLKNQYSKAINCDGFYERFLEYYFSECEFFLKVNRKEKLVGLFKGRIEFKNPNEVWFSYILMANEYRNNDLGSEILQNILKYFYNDCGIFNFYVKINNNERTRFWIKNDFHIINDFKDSNFSDIILKKRIIKT